LILPDAIKSAVEDIKTAPKIEGGS